MLKRYLKLSLSSTAVETATKLCINVKYVKWICVCNDYWKLDVCNKELSIWITALFFWWGCIGALKTQHSHLSDHYSIELLAVVDYVPLRTCRHYLHVRLTTSLVRPSLRFWEWTRQVEVWPCFAASRAIGNRYKSCWRRIRNSLWSAPHINACATTGLNNSVIQSLLLR